MPLDPKQLEAWKADADNDGRVIKARGEHIAELEAELARASARSDVLLRALLALTKERCPACVGNHDDRCWVGEIISGSPGPSYDAACAACAAVCAQPTPTPHA